MKRKDQPR